MRIALDCTHQLIPGGIKAYITSLSNALAQELGSQDELILHYRLRQHSPSHPMPRLPESQAQVRRSTSTGSRRIQSRLENHLGWPTIERATGDIDTLHGTHFWLPVSRSARQVLSVHDLTYLRRPDYFQQRKLNDYGYRYLLPHSLKRADAILACSESTKSDLQELLQVPQEKIWVIPYAQDPRFTAHGEEEYQHTLRRFHIDRPFVIYPIGTLDRRKNLDNVLAAYARAFSKGNRPLLVLTTPNSADATLQERLEDLGLSADVQVMSVGYPFDLAALMSAAEWGMYLSLYEGYGLPVAEAMACGLPLVVSDRSSVPEVAGSAALVVNPEDIDAMAASFRQLDEDGALRRSLRHAALERAHSPQFGWGRAARQTLAAYADDSIAFAKASAPAAEAPLSISSPS